MIVAVAHCPDAEPSRHSHQSRRHSHLRCPLAALNSSPALATAIEAIISDISAQTHSFPSFAASQPASSSCLHQSSLTDSLFCWK
ncbi:hypothetical protein M0R45_002008 [Rubus argutus]|uniref:Uncharacterized protein n=1 Tax=Rubus argutus TaxID=59490 RepID=A0AAW1VKF4_RUBAR